MSGKSHVLAQHLFGKTSVEDCSLQEIKSLVNRYPYFAPAQFLLLEKLKSEDEAAYQAQLQKAILYYPDPLQFQFFIDEERFLSAADPDFLKEPDPVMEWEERAVEKLEEEEQIPEAEPEPPVETVAVTTVEETESTQEAFPLPVADSEDEKTVSIEMPAIEEPEAANAIAEEEPPTIIQETTIQQEENADVASTADTPELTPTLPPPVEASRPATSEFTFEPFHTVDYFASQGIKLSQEELPKDKFGKQLKSFTEWLKTMKKLPASQISQSLDHGTENKVQHLAEDSIHQSDVWTEAMAEVWIKQGNTQKAREVYNKLSLLNPSKKAYFAAKIENLKHS